MGKTKNGSSIVDRIHAARKTREEKRRKYAEFPNRNKWMARWRRERAAAKAPFDAANHALAELERSIGCQRNEDPAMALARFERRGLEDRARELGLTGVEDMDDQVLAEAIELTDAGETETAGADADGDGGGLGDLTKDQLLERALELGAEANSRMTKAQLIEAIEAADSEAGDQHAGD